MVLHGNGVPILVDNMIYSASFLAGQPEGQGILELNFRGLGHLNRMIHHDDCITEVAVASEPPCFVIFHALGHLVRSPTRGAIVRPFRSGGDIVRDLVLVEVDPSFFSVPKCLVFLSAQQTGRTR